jgi:hypothetical protein
MATWDRERRLLSMSQIYVSALVTLSAFALLASPATAQAQREPTTVRVEQEIKIPIELPALPNTRCEAAANSEYQQRNTIARLVSTIAVADCTAASGTFTATVRVRDESGEIKPLDFSETWQRSDDQDVKFTKDYPIGENVELLSVRVRGLRCTCADAPKEEAAQ